jgi:hypothetical protein
VMLDRHLTRSPKHFNSNLARFRHHRHTVRSLISGGPFLVTHCPQICVRKEISRPGFLDVNR